MRCCCSLVVSGVNQSLKFFLSRSLDTDKADDEFDDDIDNGDNFDEKVNIAIVFLLPSLLLMMLPGSPRVILLHDETRNALPTVLVAKRMKTTNDIVSLLLMIEFDKRPNEHLMRTQRVLSIKDVERYIAIDDVIGVSEIFLSF